MMSVQRSFWLLFLAIVGFAGICAAFFVVTFSYVLLMSFGSAKLPADCAIVFGTAVRPMYDAEGKVIAIGAGPGIQRRVTTAADLYKEGSVKKIFMAGGRGEGTVTSEASVMRELAIARGVDPRDIEVEEQSHSTWENVRNTLPRMQQCSSIVGISDGYHLARIGLLAARAGRAIETYPASKRANWQFELKSTARETLGILLLPLNVY